MAAAATAVCGFLVLRWLSEGVRDEYSAANAGMQLGNLKMAIWAYSGEVRLGRAFPPSNKVLADHYQSGAESLGHHLMGPAREGHTVVWNGVTSRVGPYYAADSTEVRSVWDPRPDGSAENWLNLPNVTAQYKGFVFLDRWSRPDNLKDVRPVLYFAAPFHVADNEAILKVVTDGRPWAPADYRARFARLIEEQAPPEAKALLLSAGRDRQYLTGDDIVVFVP